MLTSSANIDNLLTDTWVKASWQEFIKLAGDSSLEAYKFYYHQGYMRIEMAAVGSLHARHNSIIARIVNFYATLKNIRIVELNNASYRKPGVGEFQPDLSYYVGSGLKLPPRTNSPIDLNEFPSPSLVVEIGASSVSDDLGWKRLLYERANVQEYWVINANADKAIAFEISDKRSGEIHESKVLPGLALAVVEEALLRSQTQEDLEINRWLLQTFS